MKKILITLFALIMLFTGITFTPVGAATTETITLEGSYLYQETKVILNLMNKERAKQGLHKLTMDENLCKLAETRAPEVYVYFSHTRPNGQWYNTVGNGAYSENICSGQEDGKDAYRSWYNSSAHYENMMKSDWKSVGIAAFKGADGRIAWVQLFGVSVFKQKVSYAKDKNKEVKVNSLKMNKYDMDLHDDLSAGAIYEPYIYGDNTEFGVFVVKPSFKWTSSNEKVAKFNSKGELHLLKSGSTTITAKGNGMTIKKKITVTSNYSIKYDVNGGVLHEFSPREYCWTATLKSPKKQGYLFSGWYESSDYNPNTKVKELTCWNHGNIKIYAKWTKVKLQKPESLKLTISKSSKKITVDFKDVNKSDGYQIYCSTNKDFRSSLTTKELVKDSKLTISNAKKGKTYYVKVRAYRLDSTGKKVYGPWSVTNKLKFS